MSATTTDKKTLGVTPEGAALLQSVMDTGWFNDEMDVYKLAISLAYANGLIESDTKMVGLTTKWNVGTLDPDGLLRSMVKAFEKEKIDRPYACAEKRASAGLRFIKREIVDNQGQIADLFKRMNAE